MAHTPARGVHWALHDSPIGSPFSEGSSTDSVTSTSTVQYVNGQLIAHGFVQAPGLNLDGLANSDMERVVKCLQGMLSQRMEDMFRTETLSTKSTTLSYENARLSTMLKSAEDRAFRMEQEVSALKNRLETCNRDLQSSKDSHKRTLTDLQTTRSSLLTLRQTHSLELKKSHLQLEKTQDKITKILDAQVKLSTTAPAGLRCANLAVGDGNVNELMRMGKGYLEVALEDAEKARKGLKVENDKLKAVVLGAVNKLQRVVYTVRSVLSEKEDEPAPMTLGGLFPMSPTGAAGDTLDSLIKTLRDSLVTITQRHLGQVPSYGSSSASSSGSSTATKVADGELERMQTVINDLRSELEQAKQRSESQATAYTTEIEDLLNRFASDPRLASKPENGDVSVDLMISPVRDEEKARLEERCRDLEEERKKYTEATLRLGKDRAALEAEKVKLAQEQRDWEYTKMLAELPPTPAPELPQVEAQATAPAPPPIQPLPAAFVEVDPPVVAVRKSPRKSKANTKSPRKSPSKASKSKSPTKAGFNVTVGKAKKHRVHRRSSSGGLGLSTPTNFVPSYETEVIPSQILAPPVFKTSLDSALAPSGSQPLLLTSTFVLPPPSPYSALPPASLVVSPPNIASVPAPKFMAPQPSASTSTMSSLSSQPSGSSLSSAAPPATPSARRPFPMAKPNAPHMIHAYSPVKPSPLSRILMLADTPPSAASLSPASTPLGVLTEEDEEEEQDVGPPAAAIGGGVDAQRQKSLAEELGVDSTDDDDSPLREKKVPHNVDSRSKAGPIGHNRFTAKEKGKGRADPQGVTTRSRTTAAIEKENHVKRSKTRAVASSSSSTVTKISGPVVASGRITKSVAKPPAPSATGGSRPIPKLPPGKGGARRVPIDSAEAAPVGRGWKG
ncbi:hypothetical protein JAAARDRAFT_45107 [Jaapia argillacea MUCL 33604]|uniref:Afadin and alpha-actinin-binding-domain-containing protein n=1 Tax=Jaapia argillacea MUCL 33604 TaxID=933084 RepID=A0A067Q5Q1_9AGAM|nr:hypothetical protein JAAARDRAFT_45107 [Jaapia argillacea MUCL 33604]